MFNKNVEISNSHHLENDQCMLFKGTVFSRVCNIIYNIIEYL